MVDSQRKGQSWQSLVLDRLFGG